MKTLSLTVALLLLCFLSSPGQQERYTKNSNVVSQGEEAIYQPVKDPVPIKPIPSAGGAHADCFYYGDPCGMYLDKEWLEGEAILLDGERMQGTFRYNICGQKMEGIVEGDTFAFARPGELRSIHIGNKEFVYRNFMRSDGELAAAWFEILCQGDCSLLMRRYIKYRVTDGDDDHTDDLLYRIDEYYSCKGKRVLERVYQTRKDVLTTLGEHENAVAAYMRSEKLNVREQDDLVRIFRYYNGLN